MDSLDDLKYELSGTRNGLILFSVSADAQALIADGIVNREVRDIIEPRGYYVVATRQAIMTGNITVRALNEIDALVVAKNERDKINYGADDSQKIDRNWSFTALRDPVPEYLRLNAGLQSHIK